MDVALPAVGPSSSAALVAGSDQDFDRLYRASYSRLLVMVGAIVRDQSAAEDCVQETFARAYRGWSRWRGDAPAEAWLHQIALNVATSHLRWRKLRNVGELVRRAGPPATIAGDLAGLRSELKEALARLPAEQAAAIVLRFHHGYSNREIAHVLQVPESTVASRIAKAKQQLRSELTRAAE